MLTLAGQVLFKIFLCAGGVKNPNARLRPDQPGTCRSPLTTTWAKVSGLARIPLLRQILDRLRDKPLPMPVERSDRWLIETPSVLAVEKRDTSGGSGANFIVVWDVNEPVYEALIEAIMVGFSETGSISFASPGRAIMTRRE